MRLLVGSFPSRYSAAAGFPRSARIAATRSGPVYWFGICDAAQSTPDPMVAGGATMCTIACRLSGSRVEVVHEESGAIPQSWQKLSY